MRLLCDQRPAALCRRAFRAGDGRGRIARRQQPLCLSRQPQSGRRRLLPRRARLPSQPSTAICSWGSLEVPAGADVALVWPARHLLRKGFKCKEAAPCAAVWKEETMTQPTDVHCREMQAETQPCARRLRNWMPGSKMPQPATARRLRICRREFRAAGGLPLPFCSCWLIAAVAQTSSHPLVSTRRPERPYRQQAGMWAELIRSPTGDFSFPMAPYRATAALPANAVIAFNLEACPAGWEE